MATTTIRLGDLKEKVAMAAEQAGKSTHAYILDAIAESVARDLQRAEFVGAAMERRASYRVTGRTVSFDDMEAYAMASARGRHPTRARATVKKASKAG
jgi:predicted transcriptional regulator